MTLVGYHNMGHPNLGIKTPSKAQNTTMASQGEPSSSDPKGKTDYSTPKSSPGSKEAQYALSSWPNTEVRPARGRRGL